jgi:UDP-glucose 4-epimerase
MSPVHEAGCRIIGFWPARTQIPGGRGAAGAERLIGLVYYRVPRNRAVVRRRITIVGNGVNATRPELVPVAPCSESGRLADADPNPQVFMTVDERTILVTGGAGFIGQHLVDALAPDNEVRVLDHAMDRADRLPGNVERIRADIRDEDALASAMRGVDVVFHLAAMVSVSDSVTNPRECHDVNVTATVSLLDRARAEDARVVLASSAAVYGDPDAVPVAEDARKRPRSPYGISKLALDHYARRYAELYDLPTVALRFFNVYGPGQRGGDYAGVIDVFRDQVHDGGPVTVDGDGQQTRDFVHVGDVVRAARLAAVTDHTGEAFNIGTGERVTIRRLAELVRETVGVDADIVHTDPRPGDVRHSCADIEKARSSLGFEPEIALADGLSTLLTE